MAKKTSVRTVSRISSKDSAKSSAKAQPDKRRSTRFSPDAGAMAYLLAADGRKLAHPVPCLIVEESFAGCGLICIKNVNVLKGAIVDVKVGRLARMKAEVRWTKMLDTKAIYFGLTYLD